MFRNSWKHPGAWNAPYQAEGARASAAIYSLIETAKANHLEPYWYLRYLFKHLPEAMTENDFMALLPHHIDKEQIVASVD